MGETKFLLIQQSDGRIGIEMTKSSGRRQLIPDFRDEAEANAWMIQIRRQFADAHPHIFGLPKKARPVAQSSGSMPLSTTANIVTHVHRPKRAPRKKAVAPAIAAAIVTTTGKKRAKPPEDAGLVSPGIKAFFARMIRPGGALPPKR